jgi:hypothetical protein
MVKYCNNTYLVGASLGEAFVGLAFVDLAYVEVDLDLAFLEVDLDLAFLGEVSSLVEAFPVEAYLYPSFQEGALVVSCQEDLKMRIDYKICKHSKTSVKNFNFSCPL